MLLAVLALAPASALGQHNRVDLVSTGPADNNGPGRTCAWGCSDDDIGIGVSDDGSRAFFNTEASLVASDTDGQHDVYMRSNGVTTLISTGPTGGNGAHFAQWAGSSADGSHVFFNTTEALVAADTDTRADLYEWADGVTTLVSTGPSGGNGPIDTCAPFMAGGRCLGRPGQISTDGSHVFFETTERLVPEDTDDQRDVYERSGGVTRLVSIGPSGGNANTFEARAVFTAASEDASRVFFGTHESLLPTDPNGVGGVYRREGTSLTNVLRSGINAGFVAIPPDGSRFFYETREALVPGDTDNDTCEDFFGTHSEFVPCNDIYEYSPAGHVLVSAKPDGSGGSGAHASFAGVSRDGANVYFETGEHLVPEDGDGLCGRIYVDPEDDTQYPYSVPCVDVYDRSGGTTTLLSASPGPDGNFDAEFYGASSNGSRVFYGSVEPMVPGDANGANDVFERAGMLTTQVSVGPTGTGASGGDFSVYPSRDGTRVLFWSPNRLLPEDPDNFADFYERVGGRTYLLTDFTTSNLSTSHYVGSTPDQTHYFFETRDVWLPQDGDACTQPFSSPCEDIYELSVGPRTAHPRPIGASPMWVSLVPAYGPCTSPNRTHAVPLAFGSCAPPTRLSTALTVGTPDANGVSARSVGAVVLRTKLGNETTDPDEADVRLNLSLTDVRWADTLADYAGELEPTVTIRLTDNGRFAPITNPPQTTQDFPLRFTAACTTTLGPEGGTCEGATTADALVPGMVREGNRAVWELGPIEVYDGGPDGDADTPGNTLFATLGVFIP